MAAYQSHGVSGVVEGGAWVVAHAAVYRDEWSGACLDGDYPVEGDAGGGYD
jgi:hypothetical protein